MINDDLMRSYNQYIKQQEIGHLKINLFKKLLLSLLFFVLLPLGILKIFYIKIKKNSKLFIFPFGNKEPMKTIVSELENLTNSEIVIYPKAFYTFPYLLLKDFIYTLFTHPLWTIRNLDFFGALSLKISKYYGYKVKYGISKLLLFQEYSFYSSYLTRIFENEDGGLYNLMHGVPGKEAAYFRFSKCFVWSTYFKNYYIGNKANEEQFIIVGSIFHSLLYKNTKNISNTLKYDILYAMQGDTYGDDSYLKEVFEVLEKLYQTKKVKIAIKPHPIYNNKINIPKNFDLIELSPQEAILQSNLILSHFSTILLDAKIMNKNVLAFLPEKKLHLVDYLDEREISFYKNDLYDKIIFTLKSNSPLLCNTINLDLNTISLIEMEL